MDGCSCGGSIQFNTAAKDGRIDALVPRWAWYDLAYSNAPNGVLKSGWAGSLFVSERNDGNLSREFVRLSGPALQSGQPSEELLQYYRERSPVSKLEEITTPTLVVSGWHDRLFWPNEALLNWDGVAGNDVDARLLMYDGGHDFEGAPSTETQTTHIVESVLAWLDTHFRDGDGASDLPTVSTYRAATDSFEASESFPPEGFETETVSLAETTDTSYWMLSNGNGYGARTVSFELPVGPDGDVAGVPRLTLPLTPASEGVLVFVGLEREDANGNRTLLIDQVAAGNLRGAGALELDLVAVKT
jgi:hypothetical protein